MADFTPLLVSAIVKALKADPTYTGFVPKGSIYDQSVPGTPAWPFSRVASVVVTPFRMSGLASSQARFNVQVFAKDRTAADGTILLPAASVVGQLAGMVVGALDGTTLALTNGMYVRPTWVQTLPSIDGDEAGAWKASCIFTGQVAG